MDLKHVVFVLFRYRWSLAAFVAASIAVVSAVVALRTPTYEAGAQTLVKVGREFSASQDIIEGGGFPAQKRREDIFAEVEILESRHVLQAVVDEIGPEIILHGYPDEEESAAESEDEPSGLGQWIRGWLGTSDDEPALTPRERAITALDAGILIEAVIRSDTIRMRYANEDPDLALHVIQTLLAKYLERHIEVHQSGHMEAVFEPQVVRYKRELLDLEARIASLEESESVFSLSTQQQDLIQQKSAAREDLEDVRHEIQTRKRKIQRIEAQMGGGQEIIELPSTEDQNPSLDRIRAQLVELQLEREELSQDYASGAREINAIDAEIARARELIEEQQQRVLFTNQADLADLELREETLLAELVSSNESLQAMNVADGERTKLERERTITERNYLLYVGELEQARISAVMDLARITNVRVIQPASVASTPSGPRGALLIIIALVLSTLVGTAAVFLLDYLDHSIKTAHDIEIRLGLPVLGSIAEEGR